MLKWCFSEKCKTLVEVASADDASATKEQRHEAGACLLSPKAQRTRRHKTELATALENKRKHLWGTGKTRRASLNFLGWEVCLFIHPPSICLLFWDLGDSHEGEKWGPDLMGLMLLDETENKQMNKKYVIWYLMVAVLRREIEQGQVSQNARLLWFR